MEEKRMIEIRLRCTEAQSIKTGTLGAEFWHPDTSENRETLRIAMWAANETFGKGTHWIEEREA